MNLNDIVRLWHKTQMGDMRECLKNQAIFADIMWKLYEEYKKKDEDEKIEVKCTQFNGHGAMTKWSGGENIREGKYLLVAHDLDFKNIFKFILIEIISYFFVVKYCFYKLLLIIPSF